MDIGDQIKRSEESTVRDERQKDTYLKRLAELQALEMRREEEVKELKEQLSKAENEPVRLRRQTDTTKKALDAMQMELAELVRHSRVIHRALMLIAMCVCVASRTFGSKSMTRRIRSVRRSV